MKLKLVSCSVFELETFSHPKYSYTLDVLCTCKIMKQDQLKHPIVIMRAPLIECWVFTRPCGCAWFPSSMVHGRAMFGPRTRVMIIAPPTVAKVPAIFAWLCLLDNLRFSSLIEQVYVCFIYSKICHQIIRKYIVHIHVCVFTLTNMPWWMKWLEEHWS